MRADEQESAIEPTVSQNVLFVHEGSVGVRWDSETLTLGAGDTITLPVGLPATVSSTRGATLFRIHR
jgi:mannose-6-phosphate isomerase-like protein (cupin superfamily)